MICQKSECDRKWPEAGERALCSPPLPCTQQQWFLNSQEQEVSTAGVTLNVTPAFLGRNGSRYFFANCSEVKYMFMHSPPHTCICIIWISQKQSLKSYKFWRTFCSKDFWPFTFNILALKIHNLNCCRRIDWTAAFALILHEGESCYYLRIIWLFVWVRYGKELFIGWISSFHITTHIYLPFLS